ncbi:MAG: hypothetical protein DIZ77_12185 [endosymbiont of Seepiophila jonesi]|uniref:Hemerythrin-like domain-containing protein n=1 Tax=endosymbiont of Lamellibrachia luymesi TaxID=2200907 RepID=A0A370DVU3_9GAMM|nr:MAG: hypothetical protein DIZ79_10985 [endosymbiont of Lamellibrachia luymesi]RDH90919.1 MAG: hypothetical protein DIZ77_12185 [endosymbiont of Seepiophila jonesi]
MHETMSRLYRDHVHFNKLMGILEGQLEQMKVTDQPPSVLLKELIEYTREYADGIHHPIEDHLYQIVLARTDEGRESMEQLLGHHQIIMDMTRKFRNALDSGSPSRETIEKMGRDYLEHQRSHMQFEEEKAFPLLQETLGGDDFKYATGAVPADQDPLLDPNMQEKYPALFDYMKKQP